MAKSETKTRHRYGAKRDTGREYVVALSKATRTWRGTEHARPPASSRGQPRKDPTLAPPVPRKYRRSEAAPFVPHTQKYGHVTPLRCVGRTGYLQQPQMTSDLPVTTGRVEAYIFNTTIVQADSRTAGSHQRRTGASSGVADISQ
jgi:hypothetical protein